MARKEIAPNRPKLAVFTLCQKGGVGKTTWCRGYLDIARAAGLTVAAFDADGETGQLVQYYGTRTNGVIDRVQNPIRGVSDFNIRRERDRDMLVNASELEADVILFDLPGGSVQELAEISGDGRLVFETYRAAGFQVVVVIVITHMVAAVRTVLDSIDAFGDTARYVVVKNEGFAEPDEFVTFEGFADANGALRYGKARQAIDQVGGEVIHMPKLAASTYAKLDVDSIGYSSAISERRLFPADRLRVHVWLEKFRKSLAGTVLDPVSASVPAVESTGAVA